MRADPMLATGRKQPLGSGYLDDSGRRRKMNPEIATNREKISRISTALTNLHLKSIPYKNVRIFTV
jgi:uracil phosphoribosyltransferase